MQLELRVNQEGRLYEALSWTIDHRDCSDATRAQHCDHRRWLIEFFGDCELREMNFKEVTRYIEAEHARGIMKVTIRKRLVTLRMGLDDAHRRGIYPPGTTWWPEVKSDSRPGKDLWTHDQYRQGRLAFEVQQRIGVDLLFWTGMHISDVLRWRRGDVDLAQRTWRRYNTKSKAEPAWLPIPDDLCAALEEWFATSGISAPSHIVADEFWRSPTKPLARACLRAGLPRITTLGFRRSCVSHMFELGLTKGQPAETVAQWCAYWLGHKGDPRNSDIIRRHYMRWTPRAIAAASPF